MNFTNIQNNTPPNCNCLENTAMIVDKEFARHMYKPTMREQDFYSHWDKYENNNSFPSPNDFDFTNCQKVCGIKGVSIHIWKEQSKETIINEYLNNFKITGKAKNCILIFKLKVNAGVVSHTPTDMKTPNPYHYDFL
jgi:hypothetical protein